MKSNGSKTMTTIQILGTGCSKCKQLQANTEQALAELGLDATIEKVQDINQIIEYGVMMTPALVIDGEVKCVGKVASADEIKQALT
jgi:small redox-active disulfide protein 2